MTAKPEVLVWPGAESMAALERALREQREVVLMLSTGLHNAFVNTFKRDTTPASEFEVYVQGGAELVRKLENIAGLEPLSTLEQTLRDDAWRVNITSPTPRISFVPST